MQHRSGENRCNADALSRILDTFDVCNQYISGVELNQSPCGGCNFCTRAKQQWPTFENDIDSVVPLTIRAIDNLDLNTIPLGLSDIISKK